ncbi:DNAse I-like superfamily protein [Tanacetum coccineum]
MDEFSPRARRRSALLTWQHIASLPPSLPVVYCGGFNTQKESTTGRFLLGRSREHGVVGDMRDVWPNARLRKNVSLIRTYHGFKGNKQGALEFLKLIFRALCLCWDRQTQDLHIDWILFRGRSLVPVSCEIVNDNIDGQYPSSHYPIFAEFMLPRTVRLLDPPHVEDGTSTAA